MSKDKILQQTQTVLALLEFYDYFDKIGTRYDGDNAVTLEELEDRVIKLADIEEKYLEIDSSKAKDFQELFEIMTKMRGMVIERDEIRKRYPL